MNNEKSKYDSELVSIIVPVYNRELIINETIKSILDQTYENWEAIFVDDGSTDASTDIIQKYVDNDTRFRIIQRNRSPKGAQTCRNIGLENAKGKYIIFLDSDDLLIYYCLEKRVRFMNENPDLDFSVFHVITFEKIPGDTNILWNIFNEEDDLLRFFSSDSPWQTTSPIWKSDFVKKLHWDEECISGQDWDFHIKALSLKPKYKKNDTIPDCFIRRDKVSERISRNFYKTPQILNRKANWLKNYKLLKTKGLWKKKYNRPFASYYFRFCEHYLLKIRKKEFNFWNFYKTVYEEKLIDIFTFYWTSVYLFGLHILKNRSFSRATYYKIFSPLMPNYLVSKNFYKTQEKIKLQGENLEKFINMLKKNNHYKIPL